MASDDNDVVVADMYPFYRIYKDGRVDRLSITPGFFHVPPSPEDPATGVSSVDITISPEISARLYLPKNVSAGQKLPVLVYYHGGGLVVGSAFFSLTQNYLNKLVSESNVVAISVEYRLAPEHDVPTVYEDGWTALQWVASHADEKSTVVNKQPWLTNHGDFDNIFLAGDSAGGTIVYHMAMRAGKEKLNGDVTVTGSILSCPYFLIPFENIEQGIAYKIWMTICPPSEPGMYSPMINPLADKAPDLSRLGCSRMFVCIGEKDEVVPVEIGIQFVEAMKKSKWKGEIEFIQGKGEGHCYPMMDPESETAAQVIKRIASFIRHK